MHDQFSKLRITIRENFVKKLYSSVISLCKKYFKLIRKVHRKEFTDIRDDLFFINSHIGNSYKKLHNNKKAIFYLKKSIRYALTDTNLNNSRFLLAECYSYICRNGKSIRNYKQCLTFYKIINNNKNKINILFDIAKLLEKPTSMQRIINILERENNNDEMLIRKYIDLTLYYLNRQKRKEMFLLIKSIENVNIQQKLLNVVGNTLQQTA